MEKTGKRGNAQHEDVSIGERNSGRKSVLCSHARGLLLDLLSQLHTGLLEAGLLRAGVLRVAVRRCAKGREFTSTERASLVLEPCATKGGRVVLLLWRLGRCGGPRVVVVMRRVRLVLVRRGVVDVVVMLRKRMVMVVLRWLLRLGRRSAS